MESKDFFLISVAKLCENSKFFQCYRINMPTWKNFSSRSVDSEA